jgi:hypothetical protein
MMPKLSIICNKGQIFLYKVASHMLMREKFCGETEISSDNFFRE